MTFLYLTQQGEIMGVLRILAVFLTGVGCLLLPDRFTLATESRAVKQETLLVQGKPQDVNGANGETRPGDKAKSAINRPAVSFPELHGKDGAPMMLVSAGEFIMGSDRGDEDESPVHRVYLNAFYIDKFEVTNARFAKYV